MGSNLTVNKEIEDYINNNSIKLHPVQKEILNYNDSLGDVKKMQISVTQAYFFQFFIKITSLIINSIFTTYFRLKEITFG